MSNFDFTKVNLALIKQLNVLRFNQQTFLFQQATTKAGWQVTILTTSDAVTSLLIKNFIILVASGSLILALFAWVARLLSRKITRPLVDISEHLSNKDLHPTLIDKAQVSSEMVKLTHRLIDSHDVMRNFQQQLSEQVHNKTKQLKRLNKELYSIAQKDSLTQLLNRAGFNRLAITSYRNCVRNHINMSLILIDIDHFKVINDTYGHPFGDKCIVAVAKTIQKHCKRDTDIIGRYGGEEFIIMIVGGETSEHNQRIEMIRQEIEKLKFRNGQSIVQMTVSAGLCSLSEDFSVDFEDLLQLADEQLYQSKRTGRNRISSINH
jgi:diguanylate cyclase (GGDEF)-like protein